MGISKYSLLSIAVSIALAGCAGSNNTEETISLSGVVADGYLQNATVCLDLNENKACDADEPTASTDTNGAYNFETNAADAESYPVISVIKGGVTTDSDDTSRVLQDYIMSAPAGKADFISPMTTMIQTEIESNPGMSLDSAEASVKTNLGYSASDPVDLFKDYIAAEKASNEPAENAVKYKRIRRIAQVTARALEANQGTVIAAAANAGLDKDETRNELVRLVVKQVIADMNQITGIVDAVDSASPFNPDDATNKPPITVNTSNLEDAILAERVTSQAKKVDILAVLKAGINALSSSFNTSVSDSEYQYYTIQSSASGEISTSSASWNWSTKAWEADSDNNSGTTPEYAQVITSDGLKLYDTQSTTESFTDNKDGTANYVKKDAANSVLSQSKIQGAEISLDGKRILATLNKSGEYDKAWQKAIPSNALFTTGAKGYRWTLTSSDNTFSVWYEDASTGCTEIGDTAIDTSKNCLALMSASGAIAATALTELTDGQTDFTIGNSNYTAVLSTPTTNTGTVSYTAPDGTTTTEGSYRITTPFGGTVETLILDIPRELHDDLNVSGTENLFIVIDEGYARMGTVTFGGIAEKNETMYYNEAALNDLKNCFLGGTNNNGTGTCTVGLFLKNGSDAEGATLTRETKTMIPFLDADVSGKSLTFSNTKLDGTTRRWDFVFNSDGTASFTSVTDSSLVTSHNATDTARTDLNWTITGNGRLKITRTSNADVWMATLLDDGTMHVRRKRQDSSGVFVKNFGGYMTSATTTQ